MTRKSNYVRLVLGGAIDNPAVMRRFGKKTEGRKSKTIGKSRRYIGDNGVEKHKCSSCNNYVRKHKRRVIADSD